MGTYAADKVGSVPSSSCVGLFTAGWRGSPQLVCFRRWGVRGDIHMAVIWMGFDFTVGGVYWDVLRWSARPAAINMGWHRIGTVIV